jgi:hypothetical protein
MFNRNAAPSLPRRAWDTICWLLASLPVLQCLPWLLLSLASRGKHHPAVVGPSVPLLSALAGGDRVLALGLLVLVGMYLVAVGTGVLVGIAWGLRRKVWRTWDWHLLAQLIVFALFLFPGDSPLFVITALVGVIAFFGQTVHRRYLPLTISLVAALCALAYALGAYASFLPAQGQETGSAVEVGIAALFALALPLGVFLASAVVTVRAVRGAGGRS